MFARSGVTWGDRWRSVEYGVLPEEDSMREETCAMPSVPLMAIVDDDDSLRTSLDKLLRSVGFRVHGFASAETFLRSPHARETACLILDVRMPGMDGLALQRQLVAANWQIPIIFITSHVDDEARAQAFDAGAVAFLYKPCREDDLLQAIDAALKRS
jgi:FixJ family two-component response regulator